MSFEELNKEDKTHLFQRTKHPKGVLYELTHMFYDLDYIKSEYKDEYINDKLVKTLIIYFKDTNPFNNCFHDVEDNWDEILEDYYDSYDITYKIISDDNASEETRINDVIFYVKIENGDIKKLNS